MQQGFKENPAQTRNQLLAWEPESSAKKALGLSGVVEHFSVNAKKAGITLPEKKFGIVRVNQSCTFSIHHPDVK